MAIIRELHEIENINPNEKYGNRRNLPGENGNRTVLVPNSTLHGNAHYSSFINLTPTVFSDRLQRCFCLTVSLSEYGIGKECLGTTDYLRLKCGTF